VHNLAAVPGDASTYFAASEVGGLFKSMNGGGLWSHLDGYLPGTAWDVDVAPGGARVYATSFNEGRTDTTAVLQVSTDGGVTWSGRLPAPPAGCAAERAAQPSGFGIALRPGTSEVLAGTNCGLARSTDDGGVWTRFDPTPNDGTANSVWDVVALPGGRTYACGDDGLLMSLTGAPGTWVNLGPPSPFPGGFCSLAVSPEEANVVFAMFAAPILFGEVFAAVGGTLFQGVVAFDGTGTASGVTWIVLPNPDAPIGGAKARLPFVVTNDRSTGYDVWAGIGNMVRGTCATPAVPSPTTSRCTSWAGTLISDAFTDFNGQLPQEAHGDSGDLVFDPTTSVDACPTLYSSDGGIYKNSLTQSPACHDPDFQGANIGLHAFLLWDMEGVSFAGADDEDLYFGTQDNGLYYTSDAGKSAPTWKHGVGGDTYDLAADASTVVVSSNGGDVTAGDRGFVNMDANGTWGVIAANPPLDIPGFIARAGSGRYFIAINTPSSYGGTAIPVGVRDVPSVKTSPLGSALGTWTSAKPPCHIEVGVGPAGPQPYILAGRCFWPDSGARSPFAGDELWTYKEVSPGVSDWVQIPAPPKTPGGSVPAGTGFGLVAVDPSDASRLYASIVGDGDPRMMRSNDGGSSWTYDAELTNLMSGGGEFIPYPQVTGDGIFPYLQPLMVTFDPEDPNFLVAGGASSGVFVSSDGGQSWSLLTDPFTPGASGTPHLPRPMFAHFDHDKPGVVRVYLGTGRGIWRVDLAIADLRVTKTDSSDPAYAGESLTYTITVANDGPSDATDVTVSDTLPPEVVYASSSGSCVESPAGTLTCAVGALAAGTQTSFTVTVDIPADLVYANGGPKTITNSASVSAAEIDPDPSDNSEGEDTLVKAKADVGIVSFDAVAPPPEVIIGEPVDLTLRKVITDHGPSSPVDVSVSRTATPPAGSSVSPAASSETAVAVAKDELRTIDETFTITCGAPGAQTFSFANALGLVDSNDVDPDLTNNTASATVTVECVVPVAINIQPGSFPNAMNLNGHATVAVLTTEAGEYGLPLAFDAATIDPLSVLFGPAALVFPEAGGATEVHSAGHVEDSRELNEKKRDKDLDMVLHFSVGDSGLTTASTEACVKGTFTAAGGATYKFFGCDSVKVSP
jgi:uncharacterized repeat protein (TIGR01451 family)